MFAIPSEKRRHRIESPSLRVALILSCLFFSLANGSALSAQLMEIGKPFAREYFLDVKTGKKNRRLEIKIFAAYIVVEHPPNIRHYKLDVRVCLMAGLQRHVIQWEGNEIVFQLESNLEEIATDAISCMQRLRNVKIERLKLQLHGVKDKGPFRVRPLPKEPERPIPLDELEHGEETTIRS